MVADRIFKSFVQKETSQGFLFSFPEGVDYGFPVTDILVNAPASIIAALGPWRIQSRFR
jgi:hypothetical protein